jgi:hypothetical protein
MMNPAVICQSLNPDCEIIILDGPARFEPAVQARIDEFWIEQKQIHGDALFDGPVLSLVEAAPSRLVLRWTSYRRLLAKARAPNLHNLDIRPLGITAILNGPDGVVLGRRSATVAILPNRWEPAPSGTLTESDPAHLILEELEEELGLARDRVSKPIVIGLSTDVKQGVTDILLRLTTDAVADEIRDSYKRLGTDEYSEIAVVPVNELAKFIDGLNGNFVPILPDCLRLAGLLA